MVSGGCQKVYVDSNLSSRICGKRKRKKSLKGYWIHRSLFWKVGCWAADCCRLEGEAGESSLYAWPALGLFSWPLLLAVDRVWPPDLLFDSQQLFLHHHTETGSTIRPVAVASINVFNWNTLITSVNLQYSQSEHSTCAQQIIRLTVISMKLCWNRSMGNSKTINCLPGTLRI